MRLTEFVLRQYYFSPKNSRVVDMLEKFVGLYTNYNSHLAHEFARII